MGAAVRLSEEDEADNDRVEVAGTAGLMRGLEETDVVSEWVGDVAADVGAVADVLAVIIVGGPLPLAACFKSSLDSSFRSSDGAVAEKSIGGCC